jgi:single-strand DNA-binding protein
MNEITIHGNVTADLTLSFGRNGAGVAFTSFSVAVNRSYFDRTRNTRVDMPTVFHRVVAFGKLAENAAATLRKGTAVAVTGQLADGSYTPDGWDRPIRRHRLEASDIAVSLRWATATITRARDTNGSNGNGGEPTEPAQPAGTAESTDDRQDG